MQLASFRFTIDYWIRNVQDARHGDGDRWSPHVGKRSR
jgi:hypothetical protein